MWCKLIFCSKCFSLYCIFCHLHVVSLSICLLCIAAWHWNKIKETFLLSKTKTSNCSSNFKNEPNRNQPNSYNTNWCSLKTFFFAFYFVRTEKIKNARHHWKKNVNTASIIFVLKIKMIRSDKRNYTLINATCSFKWSAKLKVILIYLI